MESYNVKSSIKFGDKTEVNIDHGNSYEKDRKDSNKYKKIIKYLNKAFALMHIVFENNENNKTYKKLRNSYNWSFQCNEN